MSSRDFYDGYAERQIRVGINDRHRSIQRWLRRFGLVSGMDVLEIGCGVGTQTELIARDLRGRGVLVAVDLSPRSVELARHRVSKHSNVRVIAGDVLSLELDQTFDVIVLPDVIEHIPLDRHRELLARVRRWLTDQGWALIHMPNPFFQEWCRKNRPELLQVVDQPVHTETLAADCAVSGLYIHSLRTYPIWVPECDYQVLLLKVRPEAPEFHFVQARVPSWQGILATVRHLLWRVRGGPGGARENGGEF